MSFIRQCGRSFSFTQLHVSFNPILTSNIEQNCMKNLFSYSQALSGFGIRFIRTTRKYRLTYMRRWWAKPKPLTDTSDISKSNKQFLEKIVAETYSSPVKSEPIEKKEWSEKSVRCGLIARKIGIYPMWLKNGKRVLCTLLQVNDNHVIRSYTSEEYAKKCIYQNRWLSFGCGAMIIGAEGSDPQSFTSAYCGLFTEAGVAPKKKLTTMFVTDDALLPVGTPLSVNHFKAGDYVDCFGVTVERGFRGVRKRWGFKGLPKRNNTKAENRPGSISVGRKRAGPYKGSRMAGHMGSKRSVTKGLKIWRINTKHNIIFVNGPAVPGSNGSWVFIYDSKVFKKRPSLENPPPFPTFMEEDRDSKLPENLYAPEIHPFSDPTVVFVETEEEKKAGRVGAKLAKVRTNKKHK